MTLVRSITQYTSHIAIGSKTFYMHTKTAILKWKTLKAFPVLACIFTFSSLSVIFNQNSGNRIHKTHHFLKKKFQTYIGKGH